MKKISVLILASAVFFLSCKTTRSSAETAAHNLSDAGEISRTDGRAENGIVPEEESAPAENQALASDEIQDGQDADEKNESDENAHDHDEDEIEEIAGGFTQERSPDEASQETDSSSNESAPHGNSSENEGEDVFAHAESVAQEEVPSEETVAQDGPHGESAMQGEQASSQEERSAAESENATVENGREEDSAQNETAATENGAADSALPRDSVIAESSPAQDNSDSRTQPAIQTDSQSQTQPTIQTESQSQTQRVTAHNSTGENSASQNHNSRERQNNATRQNRRQDTPADSTQTEPNNVSASERNRSRTNSTNGNSAQTVPTEKSETEDASSRTESGDEIASAYDFTGGGENASEAEVKPEPPVPSRSLTLKRNQFVDIIYPGNGWIYLGEEGGDHFTFYGRKQRGGENTFTLRSKKAGRALLHFYKNDALTGKYIDDYIELNVTQETALDASHVEAPSYAQAVPQRYERKNKDEDAEEIPLQGGTVAPNSQSETILSAESKSAETVQSNADGKNAAGQNATDGSSQNSSQDEAASEKVQTVIQTSRTQEEAASRTSIAATQNSLARNESPETDSRATSNAASLLELAQKAYDEKRYADALDFVRKFLEIATENIDAGIFLEGQILEAKSEVRDIKAAIGDYDTIVKNWPQSKLWKRANERGIYLKRFYIDIR